jgi:hypothetical protein
MPHRFRRVGALTLAVAGLTALVLAAPAGAAKPIKPPADGEWLFTQSAERATLKAAGRRSMKLTLKRPAEPVGAFLKSPQSRLDFEPLGEFTGHWNAFGFNDEPPSAAIHVPGGPGGEDAMLVSLSRPQLGASSLSYTAHPLEGTKSPADLKSFARLADPELPENLGATDLYIDDADDDSAQVAIAFSSTVDGTFALSAPVFGSLVTGDSPLQFGQSGSQFEVEMFTPQTDTGANIQLQANPVGNCVAVNVDLEVGGPLMGQAGNGPQVTLANGSNLLPTGSGGC